MKRIAAIIQARKDSVRLPGKMLLDLNGHKILEWVIKRTIKSKLIHTTILATTNNDSEYELTKIAKKHNVEIFRGDENNVLKRFIDAADFFKVDTIIRICADNPFISHLEINKLILFYVKNNYDYAYNHQSRDFGKYSDGFGAEIMSLLVLKKINNTNIDETHKEHLTKYIWDNKSLFNIGAVNPSLQLNAPDVIFDINTSEEYNNILHLTKNSNIGINSTPSAIISKYLSLNFDYYLQKLFPFCRSITGVDNVKNLKVIQEILPIKIKNIKTGTKVYDWEIPKEWHIKEAWIETDEGKRIVDFKENNLHVVSHSSPIKKVMNWSILKKHIHFDKDNLDSIPYRTTYYDKNWGFCVNGEQLDLLKNHKGGFNVFINSELTEGELTFGEILIRGSSKKEILISCYFCHPSMANDSLSGVILTAFLGRYLSKLPKLKWTYRIVFVPETIGAIAYCALNEKRLKEIDMGLVITTVGGPGVFGYKQSWDTRHPINRLIEETFKELNTSYIKYPFDIHGSDERQYSSQGFKINIATITKDKYYEYKQYHSSGDNLDFVNGKQLYESYIIYKSLLNKLEDRIILKSTIKFCEPMLSKRNLYPKLGGNVTSNKSINLKLDNIMNLLYYSDGSYSLQDISIITNIKITQLKSMSRILLDNKLLSIV